jgi:prephenate dehydratase
MKIAFPGERGAFTELAAVEYFGRRAQTIAMPEFAGVFKAVDKGIAQYGIVPIENSLAGSIHENYDLLLENRLFIVGEIVLRISQFLIANPGVSRSDVRRVFSFPPATAQCKKFLRKMRNVSIVPVSNTAVAVKKIRDEKLMDAAAIGSMQAAIDYGMNCLARNIEDNPHNITRFLVLAKKPLASGSGRGPQKSSIVFSTRDMPGALFKALSVFALRDINLFKIESRPVTGRGFNYLFYLDFEGNATDKVQQHAINHLQEITSFYRMLGSYPVGRVAHPQYRKRK